MVECNLMNPVVVHIKHVYRNYFSLIQCSMWHGVFEFNLRIADPNDVSEYANGKSLCRSFRWWYAMYNFFVSS